MGHLTGTNTVVVVAWAIRCVCMLINDTDTQLCCDNDDVGVEYSGVQLIIILFTQGHERKMRQR